MQLLRPCATVSCLKAADYDQSLHCWPCTTLLAAPSLCPAELMTLAMTSTLRHQLLPQCINDRTQARWRAALSCISLIASPPLLAADGIAGSVDETATGPLFTTTRRVKLEVTKQEKITLKYFRAVGGVVPEPFFEQAESIRCRAAPQRFCRDFSKTEVQVTSLRFMVPPVPGLTPKSLTFRHNAVIANYTFK